MKRRSQGGFTLIELMVSLILFSVAIAGVLAIAVSMAQGFRDQRQVVQTEGTARGALDYISDALRLASPAINNAQVDSFSSTPLAGTTTPTVQAPNVVIGIVEDMQVGAGSCKTGAIRVFNNTAAPDELEILYASGAAVTSLNTSWTPAGVATTANVVDASNFAVGDTVLITDGTPAATPSGHVAKITAIAMGATTSDPDVLTLAAAACTLATTPTYGASVGEALVIRVLRARFYIGTFDGISPVLLLDPDGPAGPAGPEPLADYVEDFQVAVGIDEAPGPTGNGLIDVDEWGFSGVVGTIDPFSPGKNMLAMRLTLVARAPSTLAATTATFTKFDAEDHVPGGSPDTFRRRVLTSTIDIRNLGASP
jgi:prepilin-type N-terminal cleavage/methylation domain-containing protein